jgi:hypothetical protein
MSVTLADGVVLTVEIGFSTTAGSGTVPLNSTLSSITWTDVSSDVRSCSINRGRSSELDSFNTGSCQITFANADRKYDPENAAGTYYGKLTPGRPIRIRATPPSGSATGIFFGFVDQFNQQYTNPTDATTVVTASDAFKVMNLITLPSYWEYQVRSRGIAAYWLRMDEATGASSVFDSLQLIKAGDYKTPAGSATTAVSGSSLVANDSNTSAVFDGTRTVHIPLQSILAGQIVSFWIQTDTTTTGSYGIYTFLAGSGQFPSCIGMDVAGGVGTIRVSFTQLQFGPFPGVTEAVISSVVVNDGKPHHIMFGTIVSGIDLYVDGILATTAGSFADWTDSVTIEQFGIARTFAVDTTFTSGIDFTSNFVGTIDDIVGYPISLGGIDENDVSTNYAIGVGTYLAGNSASARLTSLLTMAGWMSDGTDITTATSTVQGINTQGKTLLAALKECEAADQGRLFVDGSGKVAFISHDTLAKTTTYNTSQRTFGDSSGELPFTDIEFVYNDQLVKNRAIAERNNGATVTVNDTTSQGQYFIRTDSQSGLINDTDQAMTDIANVRLATYKQPAMRVESLGVSPRANTTIYTGLIGDEIGTRITVKRRPQGVGSVISKELLIEGVSHDIGPQTWSSTYNLSPAPLDFFILDSSTFGVLDTNLLGY